MNCVFVPSAFYAFLLKPVRSDFGFWISPWRLFEFSFSDLLLSKCGYYLWNSNSLLWIYWCLRFSCYSSWFFSSSSGLSLFWIFCCDSLLLKVCVDKTWYGLSSLTRIFLFCFLEIWNNYYILTFIFTHLLHLTSASFFPSDPSNFSTSCSTTSDSGTYYSTSPSSFPSRYSDRLISSFGYRVSWWKAFWRIFIFLSFT